MTSRVEYSVGPLRRICHVMFVSEQGSKLTEVVGWRWKGVVSNVYVGFNTVRL